MDSSRLAPSGDELVKAEATLARREWLKTGHGDIDSFGLMF
ncbi:MAG: hypothetical protein AAFV90_29640 [Cyanobacteria bacterium J06634_5]